jgi:hypothetical protein
MKETKKSYIHARLIAATDCETQHRVIGSAPSCMKRWFTVRAIIAQVTNIGRVGSRDYDAL